MCVYVYVCICIYVYMALTLGKDMTFRDYAQASIYIHMYVCI